MLAGRYHGCNCVMGRCKCSCFCTTLRKKARCILHHCIPPASLQLRTGPTWATWSSVTCPLAAEGGEKCRTIYVCISFLRAVVVVFVVSVIILIHFVVVIFSLRMYAQQVFSALFTGVLNTIVCVCRRGVSGVFPAGLRLVHVSSVRDSLGRRKCLPIFYRGLMCMCCVCVHAHTHTLNVG